MIAKRRSLLERRFEKLLNDHNTLYEYEVTKIPYFIPLSNHKYIVDWSLGNGVLIETKGYLADLRERQKYQLIKEQHPSIDLRFVFQDPNKICGGTKSMTHSAWADRYSFKWCSIQDVPQLTSWFNERKRSKQNV